MSARRCEGAGVAQTDCDACRWGGKVAIPFLSVSLSLMVGLALSISASVASDGKWKVVAPPPVKPTPIAVAQPVQVSPAQAPEKAPDRPTDKKLESFFNGVLVWPPQRKSDIYIDRFIDVSGAWWLELKCDQMPTPAYDRFEWQMSAIADEMHSRGLHREAATVQGVARSVANKTVCGDRTLEIITQGEVLSRNLVQILGLESFQGVASIRERRRIQMGRVASALGIMQRCEFATVEARDALNTVISALAEQYALDWDDQTYPASIERIQSEARTQSTPECSKTLEGITGQMMLLATRLGVLEEVWDEDQELLLSAAKAQTAVKSSQRGGLGDLQDDHR